MSDIPPINTGGYTYYNDIEHFPCEVLRKNIKLGLLPEGYVDERDIREVHATDLIQYRHIHLFAGIGGFPLGFRWAGVPTTLRIITGGFPCQDISNAGKRAGLEGEHSGLWFEMYRLIQETIDSGMGPDYICIENVSAITGRGLSRVLADLAQAGFDAEWRCLRAHDFGAPHQRERIFVVAYANQFRKSWAPQHFANGQCSTVKSAGVCQWENRTQMADTSEQGLQKWRSTRFTANTAQTGTGLEPEPKRCSAMADTSSQRRQQESRGAFSDEGTNEGWTSPHHHQPASHDQGSQPMAHASSSGWQKRNVTSIANEPGYVAWRTRSPGTDGQSESNLGGMFTRLPARLDRYRWPAGPGEQQHIWEPPRTITGKQKNRVARLKALGNAIVPQCAEYIGQCIIAREKLNTEEGSEVVA